MLCWVSWKVRETEARAGRRTDFLCFFSRSWFLLCRPSRCSLVSCSSAVSFLHFFFSCCTERCISSLSACTSASCRIHNHTHALLVIPQYIFLPITIWWYMSRISRYSKFLAFLSRCLLLCCSVSSLSSNSCWSFFLAKSISRMARLYFIRHSPPGEKA